MDEQAISELEELRELLHEASTLIEAMLIFGEAEPSTAEILRNHLKSLSNRLNIVTDRLASSEPTDNIS